MEKFKENIYRSIWSGQGHFYTREGRFSDTVSASGVVTLLARRAAVWV